MLSIGLGQEQLIGNICIQCEVYYETAHSEIVM